MAPSASEASLTTCGATCPLAPGVYHADFHDPFTITIEEPGWQQEPADGQDVVVLSRTDDQQERLTFYPAPTGPLADVAALAALFEKPPNADLSEPRTVTVGGEPAVEIEVTPSGSQSSSLSVAGKTGIAIQPDHAYRFTLAQQNMSQEGALHLIVAEAPKDKLAQFLPLVDRILKTLGFF